MSISGDIWPTASVTAPRARVWPACRTSHRAVVLTPSLHVSVVLVIRLWRRRQGGVNVLLDPIRDLLALRALLRIISRGILSPVPGATSGAEARPRPAGPRRADGGLGPLDDVLPVLCLGDRGRLSVVARAAPAAPHVLRRVGGQSRGWRRCCCCGSFIVLCLWVLCDVIRTGIARRAC